MNDLIQELEQAFQMLSTIPVCGDAVDRMARARAHLINAYRIERANEEALNAQGQAVKLNGACPDEEDGHEAAGAAVR